jgi:hypothetical protein
MTQMVTAIEIAREFDLDPKRLRYNLRQENFAWHPVKNMLWIAEKGSAEEVDMVRVAKRLAER